MRRLISVPLVLILAMLIHVDWHFARSHVHRLSLDWSYHWLFCIAFLAGAGFFIACRWPNAPWHAAMANVSGAVLGAQVIEPMLEAAYYEHRLAFSVEPERWAAFWACVGAGLPALVIALWLCGRKPRQRARNIGTE